jgi:hypothetical protein
MTKNDFIIQVMISMAGDKQQFNSSMHCVKSEAKGVAIAANILADKAEELGVHFDPDEESNP